MVFTLPCAVSHSLSKEGVRQQCPKGKRGRNEGGQLEARGMGHRLLLVQLSTVMAPGQRRKTGVRGKPSKKDQMEDRSG